MKRDPLQPRPLLKPAEAMAEANRCQGCVDGACRKGCPLAVDVGAFIRRIQTGHWAGALRVMYERNPLPETCGLGLCGEAAAGWLRGAPVREDRDVGRSAAVLDPRVPPAAKDARRRDP